MTDGRRFTGIFCAFALACCLPAARAADETFVSSYYAGTITVYPRTANGDTAPVRTIRTGLSLPHDVVLDLLHRELFVPNNKPAVQGPAINVYDFTEGLPGTGDTPKRTIAGAATLLDRPAGMVVDSVHQELFVANDTDTNSSILVFALGASGNAAPIRVLQGFQTTVKGPMGMVLDLARDELIVVNYKSDSGGSITTFARTAQGDAPPLRTIQGPLTGFTQPQALAFDPVHDELIVANSFFADASSLGGLLVFPRTASGNVAPIRQITGAATGFCNPIGMTLDRVHDELVVTNSAAGGACLPSVTVYARGASGNVAPLRTIGPGPLSALNNPEGVAVLTTVDCADAQVASGTPCDDGNACTTGDACSGGVCTGGQASCSCNSNAACADANPCTDDICQNPGAPNSVCIHTNNTSACSDGNACTTGDLCGGGVCNPGAPLACNDNNPCTTDSCAPASGCVFTNNSNACSDGNACTSPDTCVAGACVGGPNVCTIGVVLNEVHYDQASGEQEFVELYAGNGPVDLTGWTLTDQDEMTYVLGGTGNPSFPCPVPFTLNAGDRLVLWQGAGTNVCGGTSRAIFLNRATFLAKTGDDLALKNAAGVCKDYVAFETGASVNPPPSGCSWTGPNPGNGDQAGVSISRFDAPLVDTDRGADWERSGATTTIGPKTPGATNVCAAPPEIQGVVAAANKTTFGWTASASATRYDVVRGTLAAFPVGPGGGDEVCFDNLSGPSLVDAAVPGASGGFWYVSRGENACGNGTFGARTDATPRTTTTCP